MSDQATIVTKFCSLSGISEEEARHMLEAFQWNFEEAVRAYYENEENHDNLLSENCSEPPPLQASVGHPVSDRPQKIATLDSLRTQRPEEPEEGQAFYVGGSETGGGGQQVLGPPRKQEKSTNSEGPLDPMSSPDAFVHRVFQTAKEKGAEVLDTSRFSETGDRTRRRAPFSGVGYRLGEDVNSPSTVDTSDVPTTQASTSEPEGHNVIVKMWRDGFSLDDGPLRSYTESTSRVFMEDIQAGRVPEELVNHAQGGLVNLLLEDHHHEGWTAPPAPKLKPFSGSGTMLGHPVPSLVRSTPAKTVPVSESRAPEVDASRPVTQLQIRLPTGDRIVVRLNHSHTVGDLRQAIISQRPAMATTGFTVLTTFPSRELLDDCQTLEQAKVINSALMVRIS